MTEIIAARYQRTGGKAYYFAPQGLTVPVGAEVIVETAKGLEFAYCCMTNSWLPDDEIIQPLRPVVRLATDRDRRTLAAAKAKEARAMEVCKEKIKVYDLDMHLIRCESSFDGNKLLFFFSSDDRVDFRALVRDLAACLHSKIELRQIGCRDETKLVGGLGPCGRPCCCSTFISKFQPVSIRMAKTQGLSMNPDNISGLCGRLMCCLQYEQDAYLDAASRMPKKGSLVETPDGVGNISQVDLVQENVRVRLEDSSSFPQTYELDEIRVISNGRGRRPEGYVAPPKEDLEKLRKTAPAKERSDRNGSELTTTRRSHWAVRDPSSRTDHKKTQKPERTGRESHPVVSSMKENDGRPDFRNKKAGRRPHSK